MAYETHQQCSPQIYKRGGSPQLITIELLIIEMLNDTIFAYFRVAVTIFRGWSLLQRGGNFH